MAKFPRGTKTNAVKEYLTAHPDAAVNEVVIALKSSGIPVSKQMVSTTRQKLNDPPKKRGRKKKRKAGAKGSDAMLSLSLLMLAKKLADQLGGIEQAKAAMDALAKLQ